MILCPLPTCMSAHSHTHTYTHTLMYTSSQTKTYRVILTDFRLSGLTHQSEYQLSSLFLSHSPSFFYAVPPHPVTLCILFIHPHPYSLYLLFSLTSPSARQDLAFSKSVCWYRQHPSCVNVTPTHLRQQSLCCRQLKEKILQADFQLPQLWVVNNSDNLL